MSKRELLLATLSEEMTALVMDKVDSIIKAYHFVNKVFRLRKVPLIDKIYYEGN